MPRNSDKPAVESSLLPEPSEAVKVKTLAEAASLIIMNLTSPERGTRARILLHGMLVCRETEGSGPAITAISLTPEQQEILHRNLNLLDPEQTTLKDLVDKLSAKS